MPTLFDIFYVVMFAFAFPLWDYLVSWPAFHRLSKADPVGARTRLWKQSIGFAWPFVAVGAALWVWNDRSWESFGFSVPDGWRLWTSIALFLLLAVYQIYAVATVVRSSVERANLREQVGPGVAAILPQKQKEIYWWAGVSLTAGFCEEFLFRGYFIWTLAPWFGWWGAAALSLLIFAIAHAYQGWNGVLHTGIAGALFTLTVAIFNSLWPAIAMHALLDLGQGTIAWLALREVQAPDDLMETARPAETESASE